MNHYYQAGSEMWGDKYSKEYEYRDVTDENGKASVETVYVGTYYNRFLSDEEFAKLKTESTITGVAELVLFVAGGMFNSGASRDARVMIPYVLSFLSIAYLLMGVRALRRTPERMTTKQYEHSFGRTARSMIFTAILSLATVIMDIVFLVNAADRVRSPQDPLFLITAILMAVAAVICFKRNGSLLSCAQAEQSQGR